MGEKGLSDALSSGVEVGLTMSPESCCFDVSATEAWYDGKSGIWRRLTNILQISENSLNCILYSRRIGSVSHFEIG